MNGAFRPLALIALAASAPMVASASESAGIVLDGIEDAEVELAIRDSLGSREIPVVDRQTMAAARAFVTGDLDETTLRSLGEQAGAAVVLLIQVKESEAQRAVRVLAVGSEQSVTRVTMSTVDGLPNDVADLVTDVLDELLASAPSSTASSVSDSSNTVPVDAPTDMTEATEAANPAPEASGATDDAALRTSQTLAIPGLEPPELREPLVYADPMQPYVQPVIPQSTLPLEPMFVYGGLGARLGFVKPNESAFRFYGGLEGIAGLGARLGDKKQVGVGVFSELGFSNAGVGATFGPAILQGDIVYGVVLASTSGLVIDDGFIFVLHGPVARFALDGGAGHGPYVAMNWGAYWKPDLMFVGSMSLGWTVAIGAYSTTYSEAYLHHGEVWKHQREELGGPMNPDLPADASP